MYETDESRLSASGGSVTGGDNPQTPDSAEQMANKPEAKQTKLLKPNLTKEQQEWLNKVFIPNFRSELMRNLKSERMLSKKEREELERYQRKAEELERRHLERRGEYEEILRKKDEAHRERNRELEIENKRLLDVISDMKIDKELMSLASLHNAVNTAQVAQLLKNSIRLDEKYNPMVLDENGERELNEEGSFMTIEEKVRFFLEKNPHLVKPSYEGSGGSGGVDSKSESVRVTAITGGDLISEGLKEENVKFKMRG